MLALPSPAQAHEPQAAPASNRTQVQAGDDHAATLAALKTFQANAGPGAGVHAGDGTASWTLSAGTGTINTNRPIQATESYRIGSQTKTFTATAVLQLVEEGKVSLESPIEQYLPGVVTGNGHDGNAITVRQLLQHTSQIPVNSPNPQAGPDGTYTLAALVKDGLSRPRVSAPGTFEYSNTNYEILGMLLER
ncbi:serine hydrolase domain-containing protein [Streptomyces sp. M10(2022)]